MGVRLKVFGSTDVGRVRSNNEDTFVVADLNRDKPTTFSDIVEFDVRENGILMAVSDGMGGEAAGEVASALVVEALRQTLAAQKAEQGEARKEQIERAVAKANAEVWRAASAPDKRGMGATLTAVFVEGTEAHIAVVGDSRAYLIRNGRIRQMTRDQSFVQLLLESGVISEDEAANYPHRNVILQAMGQKPEVTVAIGRLALRRGDILLLCSDGLSSKVQADEMRDIVQSASDIKEACKKLTDLANERGGEDNITVVIAVASGDGLPTPMRAETVTQTFEVLQDYAPTPSKPPAAVQASQGEKTMSEDPKEERGKTEEKNGKQEEETKTEKAGEDEETEKQGKEEGKTKKESDEKKEEEEAKESDEKEEDDESAPAGTAQSAPPPTQEQRIKEMVTLAVVLLGLGLLIYYIFK